MRRSSCACCLSTWRVRGSVQEWIFNLLPLLASSAELTPEVTALANAHAFLPKCNAIRLLALITFFCSACI